jgi:hypothetical protein
LTFYRYDDITLMARHIPGFSYPEDRHALSLFLSLKIPGRQRRPLGENREQEL